MIYFCDSLVAFVVEIFNKFHVISCLWYESDESGAKIYYVDFSDVNFKNPPIVIFFTAQDDDEKMKTVIKMIITVFAFLESWDELCEMGLSIMIKLSTLEE